MAAAGLTCSQSARAISRDLDGLLSRREWRALRAHVWGCEKCARFVELEYQRRLALRTLRLVQAPNSLQVFRFSGF